MKLDVTRDVIHDLWPLCRSGDASSDSRALVDTFLAEHADLARNLKEMETMTEAAPTIRLSPDAERRMLDQARERARMKLLIVGGAIALGGLMGIVALGALLFLIGGRLL